MGKRMLAGCLILMLVFQLGCSRTMPVAAGKSSYSEKGVSIIDRGSYFEVVLDYTAGLTHRQIGEAYARGILAVVPDYEALADSYIADSLTPYQYPQVVDRAGDIKPQLQQEYRDEIEGMAGVFSGGNKNVRADNRISFDEFYVFNLLPDTMGGTQCSVVSVFGTRSAVHSTITARNLDWYGGSRNQLPRIQAVITYKYPGRKICSIGYLGFAGILTGFNDSKVFAAVLDSQTGTPYSSLDKRSYAIDLRYALENNKTLAEAAGYMMDPQKQYAKNHLVAFSDPTDSKILENATPGKGPKGTRVRRALRSSDSRLNDGIAWGISDAVGAVNAFMLYGNYDNYTENKFNTKRWKNMRARLLEKGDTVTPEELKEVITYCGGSPGTFSESGDLYNRMTLYTVLFQPDSLSLEVAFHPKNTRTPPDKPVFQKIAVFR